MTLSAMAVPTVAMRDASHRRTRPPCNGRSALPERFTRSLSHTRFDNLGTHMPRKAAPSPSLATVGGVRISHPDRLIYPDEAISKVQLARYYESIAKWIVTHVNGRPLTLVHW